MLQYDWTIGTAKGESEHCQQGLQPQGYFFGYSLVEAQMRSSHATVRLHVQRAMGQGFNV